MSVQMVLLPVFVLVGLTFFLLIWMGAARRARWSAGRPRSGMSCSGSKTGRRSRPRSPIALPTSSRYPSCSIVLIAIALPLRRTDLVIVLLSWVFVVTRFAHAGVFVTSNDLNKRSLAWFAGVLVLFAMWVYFALKILLV